MSKTVAVLLGGFSSEREVSLSSGRGVADALRKKGYTVREIDPGRDIAELARQLAGADAVFNALHGAYGEDGCMQGLLEIIGIPYTHSGPLASALAMDKQKAKDVLAPHGMPVARGTTVAADDIRAGRLPLLPPYVVKPNSEGSSVGVYIVRAGDNKPPLGLQDWTFGAALVEEYIPGRELSVGVMGISGEKPRALAVTEIVTQNDFYDYAAKYSDGGSRHIVPADLPAEVSRHVQELAVLAHEKLGCTGVTRSDFRYNESKGVQGVCYLETNTQPGMTPTSLVPEQAAHLGMDYGELVAWLVEHATLHLRPAGEK